jgi:YidC/Oxa1 family membrane protein insertase
MDKNTIIGFILIGLVLMVWLWISAPPQQPIKISTDSATTNQKKTEQDAKKTLDTVIERKTNPADTLGKYFSHLIKGTEKILVIETNNYKVEISSLGGSVKTWELKQYKTWDQHPVNLINTSSGGDFHLLFYTSDGKLINTKNLVFQLGYNDRQVFQLNGNDSLSLKMVLNVDNKSRIIKTLTFYNDKYSFDAAYRFEGMESIISNFAYQIIWESSIPYVEHNSIDESNFAKAFAFAGGELTEIDAKKLDEQAMDSLSGKVDWVAARNKYFAVAIIPRQKNSQRAYLEGWRKKLPDEGAMEDYSIALEMPFTGNTIETDRFTVFLGPLGFDAIKKYNVGLDKIMSLGAVWIIRPISEYVIIPVFKFLKLFIPNYGVVLIIFSFIIKIVLHPLTKSSMKSMQKMQALQPMMNEIREKYKDDPQKMNQQVMRLYKEYGVNPAGGCLPMLLQLPILYALWAVFSSAIELRQASFIWWIHDLSIPDVIARLPLRLPIFNINEISGLALLMGVTMFVQQRMSVKDPRQKMMVWMMPILMTLMFNSFPAGLNLYYFVFNLLSIAQQAWINKQHKGEPLRKVEQKKHSVGLISRIAKDLPVKPKH